MPTPIEILKTIIHGVDNGWESISAKNKAIEYARKAIAQPEPDLLEAIRVLLFACRDGAVFPRDYAHKLACAAIEKAGSKPIGE
jgi:hypothetical protein